MEERLHDIMRKRPSLFAPRPVPEPRSTSANDAIVALASNSAGTKRPPSRAGKRVLSVYLDPLAWKQLRQLALDSDMTTQALGEEAINLLFAKHGLNRSA
jgi:hypothetical protein